VRLSLVRSWHGCRDLLVCIFPVAAITSWLRGNHREPLFGSVADRLVLNDIVVDVLGRFDTRIHAFCWMSNHLHALLQITNCPLGSVMPRIAITIRQVPPQDSKYEWTFVREALQAQCNTRSRLTLEQLVSESVKDNRISL